VFPPEGVGHTSSCKVLFRMGATTIGAIVVIAGAVGLVVIFRSRAKRRVLNRMQAAVDMVKLGLYKRLSKEYAADYPVDEAKCLAASVVNSLFGSCQSDFGKQHEQLVEEKVSSLVSLPTSTRQVITDALRAQVTVDYGSGIRPTFETEWTQEGELSIGGDIVVDAMNKGILVKGGTGPSFDKFPLLAQRFLDESAT